MNFLMTYASKHGSTREIATAVAEELRTAGHIVDVRDVQDVSTLEPYDGAIVGSAVYMGNWMAEAKQFIESHQQWLASHPLWLFSSGPLGAENPQPVGDPNGIAELLETTGARGHRVFVGKLEKDGLSLGEKVIVRAVKAPYGDFREWQAVRAWAHDIAAAAETLAGASA